MHTLRIALIVTSADHVSGMAGATGSWLEEVVAPYYAFVDARCAVTVASPKGGLAPIDAESLKPENQTASTARYEADAKAQAALTNTRALAELDGDAYDALYFAGGHGTLEDFPTDPQVKRLIEEFYAAGKPVASVCHGPACLVNGRKPDGSPLVRGHRFACFTDEEETLVGLNGSVPFLLESTLVAQGGVAEKAAAFAAKVVVDAPLLTGQNPASAIPLGEAVIHQLRLAFSRKQAA